MENLKDYIRESINRLEEEFSKGLFGRKLLLRYSSVMDECLNEVFLSNLSARGNGSKNSYAVAALGGYGREELSPFSDIDLMFLIPDKFNGDLEDIAGGMLYPLWDAGLTVGHCNRTLKDCLTMMTGDITIRTSLMEMRYLTGDKDLYNRFLIPIRKRAFSRGVNTFITDQIKDMKSRRKRYGESVYLLEPHLKEGEGGLRDIQSALWIAKVKFKVNNIDELREKGALSSWEISLLEESLDFLWKVRNGLHFSSGRKNDHLAFEYQGKIAELLGYGDSTSTTVLRKFMHDYYQCAENIKYLSSVLIERSRKDKRRIKIIGRRASSKEMEHGFRIEDNGVSIADPQLFRRDTCAMMKVFRYSAELGKEITIPTQELIRNSLDIIDEGFRESKEVNDCFISILRKREGVAKVLKTMHRLGVLGRFIPEFGNIIHLPQSHHHHIYTTDIHTLFAIEEFEDLLAGKYRDIFPFLTHLVKEENRVELIFLALLLHDLGKAFDSDHMEKGVEIVHTIADRMGLSKEEKRVELIFLALLLHDLGKAFDADHVEKGVKIAHTIADRMGLSQEETKVIAFLVKNHIYMSIVAQTRDLSDEDLIIKFSQKMKDINRLRMLYILTFADSKASRSEAFTSWKATLFQELYIRAFHILEKGDFTMTDMDYKLDKIKNDVISGLSSKMPMDDIHYNLDLTPSRYLLNNSPEIISNHILLCWNLEERPLAFDIREKTDNGYYDIFIATPDFPGLFYKVCGVMVYHNMNILDAQIDTRSDGIAIELLRVNYLYNDETVESQEWNAIRDNLEKVVDGRLKVEDLVKKKESYLRSNQTGLKGAKTTIGIDNDTSDFYTVIDVETGDRFGLLYSITKVMSDMGISIYIAKITTRLMRVTDSFYVRDIFGQKIYEDKFLKRIKRDLLRTLEG